MLVKKQDYTLLQTILIWFIYFPLKNDASHLRPKLNPIKIILFITRHQDGIPFTIEFLDPKRMSHKQNKKKTKGEKMKEQKKILIIPSYTRDIRVNPNKKENVRKIKDLQGKKSISLELLERKNLKFFKKWLFSWVAMFEMKNGHFASSRSHI